MKRKRIEEESAEVEKVRVTMRELNEKMAVLKNQCLSQQEMIKTLKVKYAEEEQVLLEENKLKLIYEQRASSRTRRENNPTTFDTITSRTSTLHFDRKKENKQVLEYLHGGSFASLLGAWDYLQTNVDREMMDKLITGYKKGKFIQHKMSELTKKYETSDESLRKAIVLKYENFLSRRKYQFLSRTMDSFYDPNKKTWLPRNEKIDGIVVRHARQIPHHRIQMFAQKVDIGDVYNFPCHVGVARPLTSLVVMMIDVNLRLP